MVAAFVQTRDKQDSKVSLTFEKQHLTSSSCSACADVVFCQHIIAVILERIQQMVQEVILPDDLETFLIFLPKIALMADKVRLKFSVIM